MEELNEIKENNKNERSRLKTEKELAIKEKKDFEALYEQIKSEYTTLKFDYENEVLSFKSESEKYKEEVKVLEK